MGSPIAIVPADIRPSNWAGSLGQSDGTIAAGQLSVLSLLVRIAAPASMAELATTTDRWAPGPRANPAAVFSAATATSPTMMVRRCRRTNLSPLRLTLCHSIASTIPGTGNAD